MAHIATSSISKAVLNNDLKTLSKLIKKGKRIDIQDNLGYTPLHIAAKKLSSGCVEILLQHSECPINERSFEGCTSLFLACEHRSPPLKLIRTLLKQGADPNISNNEEFAPIHLACKNGNLDLLKLLLEFNVNIDEQDLDNYTPLHFAVDCNKKQIVEFLLKNNADTSLADCYGLNPLMLCIVRKNEELFHLILPHTKNLNSLGKEQETAVNLAIKLGKLDIIRKLIENGADVNNCVAPSPLEILDLYEENNYQIFQYIWSKINYQNVARNTGFIDLLTKEFTATDNILHLRLILQTVDLKLNSVFNKNPDIFANIFSVSDQYPNSEYFNNNKENLIQVIDSLFEQGASISTKGYKAFLNFLKVCPYRVELLQIILNKTDPIIDDNILFSAFLSHPDLGLVLLQYIPYYVTSDLFKNLTKYEDLEFVKYILNYFTPHDFAVQQMLPLVTDDLTRNSLAYFSGKVKSLVELSRDVTRILVGQTLPKNNNHIKQFTNILQNLNCPDVIKNILLLQKPINNINL